MQPPLCLYAHHQVRSRPPTLDSLNPAHQERTALSTMFECSALTTTQDLGVGVLAGSGLGGGTRINCTAGNNVVDLCVAVY